MGACLSCHVTTAFESLIVKDFDEPTNPPTQQDHCLATHAKTTTATAL
jgi:hypothetical protein